ncbi:Sec-independent protein translocase subunit TatA/TatB [Crocinitomix catalasitica]|uniref:Sec-independent protein translocase subunit TatA/TatB n=1 Tax=Crocinitomix catalasitica TaxID=184607 RepID=UPI0004870B93|nr:twin-arginine translocase TatA/TatE family subunit [Crocinitomix catalasitica]
MENVAYAGMIGMPQVILIAVVILLLFGGRKLPELMKGFGKGLKGFKDEMGGEKDKSKDKIEE